MITCGYLCPSCEGKGYNENGQDCTWCSESKQSSSERFSDEDWIKKVHEGNCCGDWEEKKD